MNRDFAATGPDQLWVADITYIPTWAGFLFLAVVVDVWSRKIVGWAMATHLRTEPVLDALDTALWQRKPEGVIHHSDHGCQPRFKGSSQQWRVDTGWAPAPLECQAEEGVRHGSRWAEIAMADPAEACRALP